MRPLSESQKRKLRRIAKGDAMIPREVRSLVSRGLVFKLDGNGYRRHEWDRPIGPTFHTYILTEAGKATVRDIGGAS